ncbi:hypothetical protein K440DRAFT_593990 [Wilcoxina mikolae CBS 423.85]|nr:hypothetical protein K440DRAFT_593990 [Wilcoxina mikolae CBS 423.85]
MSAAGKFNTGEVRYWKPPQLKTSKQIAFSRPYLAPPSLPMGLNSLDIANSANIRVTAYASDINPESFRVHIDGWGGDTEIYSAGVSWLELSPGHLEYQHGQFSTTEDHPYNRPQPETSRRITFSRPFVTPPKVVVFLRELDMSKDRNWRVTTSASDINQGGFTIHINSWADTVLYGATAGWIAYPSDRKFVFSGSSNTGEKRPWYVPQHKTSGSIGFGDVEFRRTPDVFVALNSLDVDCAANLRINATVDNVTTTDMTWHIDSWADTKLYSAGISYIAV